LFDDIQCDVCHGLLYLWRLPIGFTAVSFGISFSLFLDQNVEKNQGKDFIAFLT
jgi:hypothetical protein